MRSAKIFTIGLLLGETYATDLFNLQIKNRLSTDFITGFESGLFLSGDNNKSQFEEYNCPDQQVDSSEMNIFKTAIGPIKMMGASLVGGDQSVITDILDTVETFVGSFDKFIGVFDASYSGGDFCAGLTFGMQGTIMLEQIARRLYEDHIKKKAVQARAKTNPEILNRLTDIVQGGDIKTSTKTTQNKSKPAGVSTTKKANKSDKKLSKNNSSSSNKDAQVQEEAPKKETQSISIADKVKERINPTPQSIEHTRRNRDGSTASEETYPQQEPEDTTEFHVTKLTEGTPGWFAPKNKIIKMHYTGKLLDGTVFDSSVTRGELFEFKLGAGKVIKCWDKGIAMLTKKQKAILNCPPDMAYGDKGVGPIPPNSTLKFEVEVVDF